jgi:hypothetical protein
LADGSIELAWTSTRRIDMRTLVLSAAVGLVAVAALGVAPNECAAQWAAAPAVSYYPAPYAYSAYYPSYSYPAPVVSSSYYYPAPAYVPAYTTYYAPAYAAYVSYYYPRYYYRPRYRAYYLP